MKEFAILLDQKDNKTPIISSYTNDLFIAVKKELPRLPYGEIVFQATLPGDIKHYFIVLYPTLDPEYKKWSARLFFDAIIFFCETQYRQEPEHIEIITKKAFYPYKFASGAISDSEAAAHDSFDYFLNGRPFDYDRKNL